MLGRIFENLLAEIDPDSGETARKATGSFYTPREIVNYMVDESLLIYLKSKLQTETFGFQAFGENQPTFFGNEMRVQQAFEMPLSTNRWQGKDAELETALRELFSYANSDNPFNETETEILIKAIESCKILDPACGSGAFPIGVLQRLVFLLGKLDAENKKWKQWLKKRAVDETAKTFESGDVKQRETRLLQINEAFEKDSSDYGRKLFLIENCIYGVDIQAIAAEISKLRCFLTLIVDDTVTDDEKKNRGVNPLPNLEFKFVTADALLKLPDSKQIGLFNSDTQLAELEAIRHEYINSYGATKEAAKFHFTAIQKNILSEQDKYQYGEKDKRAVALGEWNPFGHERVDWFDSLWMFGVKAFDIVIGNPPYGAALNEQQKSFYKKEYSDVHLRTPDTFNYFISKSIRLLNSSKKGFLTFIVPNNLLFQNEYEKTRAFLLQSNQVVKVINLGDEVFTAIVPSCVFLIANKPESNYDFDFADLRKRVQNIKLDNLRSIYNRFSKASVLQTPSFVFGVNQKTVEIIKKVESKSERIDDIALEVASGISTGGDGIFRVSKEFIAQNNLEPELLHKVLKGREIEKYQIQDTEHYLIYTHKKIEITKSPQIYEYLKPYEKQLSNKRETRQGKLPWWCLHWHRYPELFQGKKILIRQTSDKIIATLDEKSFYALNSLLILKLKSETNYKLKFVLSVLNSSLCNFIYKEITQEQGRVFAEVKPQNVRKLFIPIISIQKQKPFENLVDYILFLKERPEAEQVNEYVPNSHLVEQFEEVIDALVYELYFAEDFERADIAFLRYATRDFPPLENQMTREQKANTIHEAYQRLRQKDNEIRNNLKLMDIRLADLIMPIKTAR